MQELGQNFIHIDAPGQTTPTAKWEGLEEAKKREIVEAKKLILAFLELGRDTRRILQDRERELSLSEQEKQDIEDILASAGEIEWSAVMVLRDKKEASKGSSDVRSEVIAANVKKRHQEIQVIVKPSRGEPFSRRGIEKGTGCLRAYFTYLMDRVLQFGRIPETSLIHHEQYGLASIQHRLGDEMKAAHLVKDWENRANQEHLAMVGVLHFLSGETDGHQGNIGINETTGEVWSFDNALTHSTSPDNDPLKSAALDVLKRQMIAKPVLEKLRELMLSESRQAVLEKGYHLLLGKEEGGLAWDRFLGRLEQLVKEGSLPDPAVEHISYIYPAKHMIH